MTLPDSDMLYLREDEWRQIGFLRDIKPNPQVFKPEFLRERISDFESLFASRLIEARREIERLQIAAGERMPDDEL